MDFLDFFKEVHSYANLERDIFDVPEIRAAHPRHVPIQVQALRCLSVYFHSPKAENNTYGR